MMKFKIFWISDKLKLNPSKISFRHKISLILTEFWLLRWSCFSWFSTDSKNSDRPLIWIVRMVRSLAYRIFQLRSSPAKRHPGCSPECRVPSFDRRPSYRSCLNASRPNSSRWVPLQSAWSTIAWIRHPPRNPGCQPWCCKPLSWI